MRIAPNQLSFSNPSALRQIYQSSRQNNPLRKSPWYETIDAPSGAYSTHSEDSRSKHAWRRRVLDHAFSDASLRSAEAFIIENVNDFCKVVGEDSHPGEWSKPRNMSDLCTWLAYDMMGDLVFGKRFNCLTSSEHRYVPKLLMSSTAFVYPVPPSIHHSGSLTDSSKIAHLPFQNIIRPIISSPFLMNLFGGQLARDEHAYVSYANDRVAERLAMEDNPTKKPRADMMHHMIHARDPVTSQPFTRQDLDAESSLLIAAGADTTSTTLAAAFFYLTLPSSLPILTEIQSQLRRTYVSISDIAAPSITAHTYLRAIIDETLRLAPPVPTHLPRTIIPNPSGGLMIDDNFIRQGTTVGCSAYVLHHDATAYPSPYEFLPERWIPHPSSASTTTLKSTTPTPTHLSNPSPLQSPSQISLARQSFTPFSHGSRGCVGRSLAYLELSLTLARILHLYDVRRTEKQPGVTLAEERRRRGWDVRDDEYQLRDCFLAEREGPWVEFRRWESAGKAGEGGKEK